MKVLPEQSLIFEVLWSKALRISNPKGMKKIEFFLQGTYSFRNLCSETLVTADCEYVKVLSFAGLDIKL